MIRNSVKRDIEPTSPPQKSRKAYDQLLTNRMGQK